MVLRGVRRLGGEGGVGIVTAMVLMTLMLSAGLATFAYVDQQQGEAVVERFRESSFNLSEGALNVQSYVLGGAGWPGTASSANPTTCNQSSVPTNGCPNATEVAKSFAGRDFNAATWETRVRDNGDADLDDSDPDDGVYDRNGVDDDLDGFDDADSSTYIDSEPSWDANGDGRMWVRSRATAQGRPRVLLGQIARDEVREQLPRKLVLAGKMATSNSGKKVIVDTQGSGAQAAPVAVRCVGGPAGGDPCLGYSLGQVAPNSTESGYGSATALSPEAIERLKATAFANGTYYTTGCPGNPTGAVVFVDTATPVACSYNNSNGTAFNSPSSPGLFIVANGSFSLSGNVAFHGVVYALNRQGSTAQDVVRVTGTALVQGAVFVDGAGGLLVGNSALNLTHDPAVFETVKSYGAASVVPDSFRELPPS